MTRLGRRRGPTIKPSLRSGAARAGWTYALTIAAVVAAIATLTFTVWAVFRLYVVLPVWDEWAWVFDTRKIWDGTYDWTELIRPHNEHRIAVPRLVFLADARLFAMSGRPVLVTMFLLQAMNASLLILPMAKLVAGTVPRLLLASLVILVLFSLRQRGNLENVFQVQFVGVFTAAALAITSYVEALIRQAAADRRSNLLFCLAAVACVVATYTMANGVLAGFVLVALALLLHAPWRTVAATATLSGVLAACFFYHYVPSATAQPLSYAFLHVGTYAAYFVAYLGNPVSTTLPLAETFGLLGVIGFGGATWCVATSRTRTSGAVTLLGIAGFIVATACSTAYGRAPLGTDQALESRYVTPTSLFWCALVLFWVPAMTQEFFGRGQVFGRVLLAVAIAALAMTSTWFEAVAWPDMAAQAATFRKFRDSLLAGLYDADLTAQFEVWPDAEIRGSSEFLRINRLSLFAEPEAAFLGRRITDVGSVTKPASCKGGIAIATVDPGLGPEGTRLQGSAHDEEHGRRVRTILVTDHGGIVIGYGSLDWPLGPSREWLGYGAIGPRCRGSGLCGHRRSAILPARPRHCRDAGRAAFVRAHSIRIDGESSGPSPPSLADGDSSAILLPYRLDATREFDGASIELEGAEVRRWVNGWHGAGRRI